MFCSVITGTPTVPWTTLQFHVFSFVQFCGSKNDDCAVNVNQKSLNCRQLKGSKDFHSRIQRKVWALKQLKGKMMPLNVEGVGCGCRLARPDVGQRAAFRNATGIILKPSKPSTFSSYWEKERAGAAAWLQQPSASMCSETTIWHRPMTTG